MITENPPESPSLLPCSHVIASGAKPRLPRQRSNPPNVITILQHYTPKLARRGSRPIPFIKARKQYHRSFYPGDCHVGILRLLAMTYTPNYSHEFRQYAIIIVPLHTPLPTPITNITDPQFHVTRRFLAMTSYPNSPIFSILKDSVPQPLPNKKVPDSSAKENNRRPYKLFFQRRKEP